MVQRAGNQRCCVAVLSALLIVCITASIEAANPYEEQVRRVIGWGWQELPRGQTLASDVLGQLHAGDPRQPDFGRYGPYGGAKRHGFFFFAFNAGRYQIAGGLAASREVRKLAVPDYWNHRVLLFDLQPDGSLASRTASGVIGQRRFDTMELGHTANKLHYPADCAFDPSGKFLFVADEYNHRVLQFDISNPKHAIRIFGQCNSDDWGPDATNGHVVWDSTRDDVRGPKLVRRPGPHGFFLPRSVACDGRRLFVADCDNHRVMVFDLDDESQPPKAVAVFGQSDFTEYRPNRGGKTRNDSMLFPSGLALGGDNRYLLVADNMNQRTLIFDLSRGISNGMPASAVIPLPKAINDAPGPHPEQKLHRGAVDVEVNDVGHVYVSDNEHRRVLVYHLDKLLTGKVAPQAALGQVEMSTDLWQHKPGYVGSTGLAAAGRFLYVVEPRGNRVLCFNTDDPQRRAVDLLGQFHGGDVRRIDFNKYGPNDGPDPYGFDFADGSPAMSVSEDGQWLLAADTIGGRLLFFPLGSDGLPLDRTARLAVGVPTLTSRANGYGANRFNRPSHSLLTSEGKLFVSDFQGSRILYFKLDSLAAASGDRPLNPPRVFVAPNDRKPGYREAFHFHSIDSGSTAQAVLGQVDFVTGKRGVATQRQMGKEMSGLAFDRERNWLFIAEKRNHRVLVLDIGQAIKTFMPAMAVLGQPDFEHNAPNFSTDGGWHPRALTEPSALAYDHQTKMLYVAHGVDGDSREIAGFDLSGGVKNAMTPVVHVGGRHPTVTNDVRYIGRMLAIDETRRLLWNDLFALDLSGDPTKEMPVVGWFGTGPHPDTHNLQDNNTGGTPSLLGYSVGFCHRFGGAVNATAVHPQTGTLYVADNARYRILCFQPEFHVRDDPVEVTTKQPVLALTGHGGLSPLEFSIESGRLPTGLALDATNGLITGRTTDRPGEYQITIRIKTARGSSRSKLMIRVSAK